MDIDGADFGPMECEVLFDNDGLIIAIYPVVRNLVDHMSEWTLSDLQNEIEQGEKEDHAERQCDTAKEDAV